MTAAIVHRTRQHRPRTERLAGLASSSTRSPFRDQVRSRLAVWAVAGSIGVVGIGAQIAMSGAGDVPASAAGTGTAPSALAVPSVKAHPGDSLWSIAAAHRGDVPIQRYVDALVSLNGGTARIEAGQLVRLP